jgi:soluble lytic murein transglycosylase-like protein
MAKKRVKKKKQWGSFPKWIKKHWNKPKYYTKNWFLFFNTIALALLCNVPLVYYFHRILLNTPLIRLIDYKVLVLVLDVFWVLFLIWINYWFIFPVIINKINKKLYRFKPKTISYSATVIVFVSFLFLYQKWNVDLILMTHKGKISSLILKKKTFIRLDSYRSADFSGLAFNDVSNELIRSTDYNTAYGRFLRTYRWDQYIKRIEHQYGIEPYLLAGLIMQESYGNPLQLNSQNDGGAGLMMFQPGTARAYGLKVYGNSIKTGRDKVHGLALRRLVEAEQYNYNRLAAIDERFDVAKSMNSGARFLAELYQKHQTWDNAVSAYNRGKPALVPQTTQHVRMVRYFQEHYKKNLINYENQ